MKIGAPTGRRWSVADGARCSACRRLLTVHRPPPTAHRRAGFSLVELMVVILVISVLVGLIMAGIHMAQVAAYKNEAKLTLDQLTIGIFNMKRNYSFGTVLGANTSGRTVASSAKFQDPIHDFTASGAGIAAGDKLYILAGKAAGPRTITAVAAHELGVDGGNFGAGEINLDYYVAKADGTSWPTVDIVKELDPTNAAWTSTFTPLLNSRKKGYFNCRPGYIKTVAATKQYTDPWQNPYIYRLHWLDTNNDGTDETLAEEVVCSGPDGKVGTKDDFIQEVSRLRVGG
jgi:prepilin-type N-terminal cleavage/methylation domain-containing protein